MTTTEAAPTTLTVWHFAADKLRDGRTLPKSGDTLRHDGEVIPCKSGYHGSVRVLDALAYAPGAMVARRQLSGIVVPHGSDKHAASDCLMLSDYVDATNTLHRFACWCATKALDREDAAGRTVDPRSRAAIAAKLAWLDGEIDEATLAAAWAAARAAVRAAAGDAAWAAARAAAWAAARDAARAAAWAAARDAAGDAAWAAAWAAARAAAGDAAGDAAWAAAWAAAGDAAWAAARAAAWAVARDAAWAAAWDEFNTELERLLTELLDARALTGGDKP
jgi:hypothetical protein